MSVPEKSSSQSENPGYPRYDAESRIMCVFKISNTSR